MRFIVFLVDFEMVCLKKYFLCLPLSGVFGGEEHKVVPFGPCHDSLQDTFLHTGPIFLGQCGLPLPS